MIKKVFLFAVILFFSEISFSEEVTRNLQSNSAANLVVQSNDVLNSKIYNKEFELLINEFKMERNESRQEFLNSMQSMNSILNGVQQLIEDSRKEIKLISYVENRNLLITSIFLWISITIFIVMNLVFADNLKKELYFLRNGLLRSEIKDNMIALSDQLKVLNDKLTSFNKDNNV